MPGLLLDRLEDQSLKNQVSGLTIRESMDPEDDKIFLSDLNRRIHLKELQQAGKGALQGNPHQRKVRDYRRAEGPADHEKRFAPEEKRNPDLLKRIKENL